MSSNAENADSVTTPADAQSLRVAIAQIAPVWLDRAATSAKIVGAIAEAGKQGAGLVVFGEALLPGYPFWIEHTDGARFDDAMQKTLFAYYCNQAVSIDRGDLAAVCDAARTQKMWVALGIVERASDRGGHSLYCALVLIDPTGAIRNLHRKLVPTYEERLVWAPGDGAGLRTMAIGPFTVGALNCWENWMPMARAALSAQGENLHLALWPGNRRNTEDITRFIAREGRSYTVSASALLRRQDIPDSHPQAALLRDRLPEVCADGGSAIAGPDGQWIIAPMSGEQVACADLDLQHVFGERQNFDPSGHYARPDVLALRLDRRRLTALIDDEDGPMPTH
ncbi:MAG: carbon-nitrogen hydrolase family protein [Luteimonas sp.]